MNGRLAVIRRWFPWLVIGGGIAVLVGLGAGWIGTRKPARDGLFVLAGLDLFVYVWTRVGSGRSYRTQVVMLVGVFVPQVLAVGLLRVDGFAGDGRPRLVWRWTPTAQETFARSRQPRSPVTPVLDLSVGEHDWPGYRGADRLGHAGGDGLRLEHKHRVYDFAFGPPQRHRRNRQWTAEAPGRHARFGRAETNSDCMYTDVY